MTRQPVVLVVDDEDNLRFVLATALRLASWVVVEATTGAELMRATQCYDFDLIVLDVMLPDTDGFALCRTLRAEGVETPVLFLSARDRAHDRLDGFAAGGSGYMTKPFDLDELLARARALL